MIHPHMSRYTAHTIDGTMIYAAETASQIADMLIAHCEANHAPCLAYTYDNAPGCAYPYVTWRREFLGYVGTPHALLPRKQA